MKFRFIKFKNDKIMFDHHNICFFLCHKFNLIKCYDSPKLNKLYFFIFVEIYLHIFKYLFLDSSCLLLI